jgi:hypothetical protein
MNCSSEQEFEKITRQVPLDSKIIAELAEIENNLSRELKTVKKLKNDLFQGKYSLDLKGSQKFCYIFDFKTPN